MSIGLSIAHCDWDGYRVNLIDAPGFQDWPGSSSRRSPVADAAVLWSAANGTVPVGAEIASEMINAAAVRAHRRESHGQGECGDEATVDALREVLDRRPIRGRGADWGGRRVSRLCRSRRRSCARFDERGRTTDTTVPDEMNTEIERAHAALVMPLLRATTSCSRSTRGHRAPPTTKFARAPARRHCTRFAGSDRARASGEQKAPFDGARQHRPLPPAPTGAHAHRADAKEQRGRDHVRPDGALRAQV